MQFFFFYNYGPETMKENIEDTKGITINRKSKQGIQYNDQKKPKGKTIIYKTLYRTLKIDQHELH